MKTDIDIVRARFRNEASTIYLRVMRNFELNVKRLDRQKDENVFQQLTARYADELKKELSQMAEKMVDQCSGGVNRDTLRQDFSRQISYNISELLLKIRSM